MSRNSWIAPGRLVAVVINNPLSTKKNGLSAALRKKNTGWSLTCYTSPKESESVRNEIKCPLPSIALVMSMIHVKNQRWVLLSFIDDNKLQLAWTNNLDNLLNIPGTRQW